MRLVGRSMEERRSNMQEVSVLPVGDIYEHEASPYCLCGPETRIEEKGVIYVHHALDGREFEE